MVRTQDVAHGTDQFVATVADAWIAELPEEPEILADLGVAETEQRAQLARRDRLLARGFEPDPAFTDEARDGLRTFRYRRMAVAA